ncbi:MAG: MmcQ/YjbR family DNA-binding protein [Sphingomonas phyllosphaerae]|uniref:MmcQ/YjbR family DNA-binding protein n=1 Tax=Sphingomonas phyllosphaerae TaxID=257003 RepID=UPI002FF666DD
MIVLEQVRAIALLLPEAEEHATEGGAGFYVDGKPFATVSGEMPPVVRVRDASGETPITLDADVDWTLVEDRIARSWELTAPRRLLEAGGR